ncbi:MAG: hypothetical protein Q4E65_10240, partial [Clostridia bacterium]|nr:hypothetical protein [Clostridia bacterium]
METVNDRPDANRQMKEDLLRAHFGAVRQLALTYLQDKERTETVVKSVFVRAFACIDDGENPVDVSLQLQGFTLEEVLKMKAVEPPPAVGPYGAAPHYYPPYGQPAASGYPPYGNGAYARQPYAQPQQPYAPPYLPAYSAPPAYGDPYAPQQPYAPYAQPYPPYAPPQPTYAQPQQP